MELFKNFDIGGLFQASKRMAPPWGSFRRFTNTFRCPSGTFKPYGKGEAEDNAPVLANSNGAYGGTHLGPISSQRFKSGLFQFHALDLAGVKKGVFSYLSSDNANIPIMQPFAVAQGATLADRNWVKLTNQMARLPSGNLSSCVVSRKSFMSSYINENEFDSTKQIDGNSSVESYMTVFDGMRVRGAGLPLPWTHVDPTGVAGAHYSRVVYVTIGMDGELVMSQYLQQRLSSATRDIYLSGYSTFPTVVRADVVGSTTFPIARSADDHLFETIKTSSGFGVAGSNTRFFDKRYIKPTASSISSGRVTVTATYSDCVQVGDWLMFDLSAEGWGGTLPTDLYMFQVRTIVGATITFEKDIKYLDRNTVTWKDVDLNVVYAEWIAISAAIGTYFLTAIQVGVLSNIFMVVSYSTTASSGYTVHGIYPVAWDSAVTYARILTEAKVFAVPWAGVISSAMSDWYDTTVVKTTFPPVKGITAYKELVVGFDDNAIYFSDISLGGSSEMVSGLSNIIPYGTEFGKITAVCGAEDFLYFSRERKNYVLTGDIAGSNFSISECDMAVPGAHNVKCATNAWSGQVIFANKAGIFAVTSAGAIKDISSDIKGLFFQENRDSNLFLPRFLTLTETRDAGKDGNIFKFFLDDVRGFVILLTTSLDTDFEPQNSNMLVYNTHTDKWYEFECEGAFTAEAIHGKITTLGTDRCEEDGIMRDDEKQLLVTQRLTVDAPSLEKQILQLKFYGDMGENQDGGDLGVTVGQLNDWENFDSSDRSNWNTNVEYICEDIETYIHKKRLNSSKPLATSIIMESFAAGSFTLEGMEIEGVVVQQGMKK